MAWRSPRRFSTKASWTCDFHTAPDGGGGELAGAVWAGLGLGVVNKLLEPTFEAIWGKVLILAIVIIFIQWKPAGLFPPRGRLADV